MSTSAFAPSTPSPPGQGINRFGFVMHPLSVDFIRRHPAFRWTRHLSNDLLERFAAWMPPLEVGRVRGGRSPLTDQEIEGYLFSVGMTPRVMLSRPPAFAYAKLKRAARMAAKRGAQILGLGAFTKVVGDAGVTVARQSPIPVTTGNSLTIAATLETAKVAAQQLGYEDLTQARAMIVGATGSIGSVCSRLLAMALRDVVLVSIEPERLSALERTILAEVPGARVEVDLTTERLLPECDLIVTATSAFGQRVLDISRCKPGAVILDVALPPDLSAEEAGLRPDVLVIESGEVVIPGPVDVSYNIGLPPGIVYACLAEAALLAMDGRFERFTLGRDLALDKVKEINRLFRKHSLAIAPLRTFGRLLTRDLLAEKRALAHELTANPERLAQVRAEAAARLAKIPPRSKGVTAPAVAPMATSSVRA